MRSLWLNWTPANPALQDRFRGIDYPLCFNIPRVSWELDSNSIRLLEQTVSPTLNVDLLFELERAVIPGTAPPDDSYIRGLRFCVGVGEGGFAAHAAKQLILAERDRVVLKYYERWPQGYNVVSEILPWNQLASLPTLHFDAEGRAHVISIKPRLMPVEILDFFRHFNALAPGDMVSLGGLVVNAGIEALPFGVELRLGNSWAFNVTVDRETEVNRT